MDISILLLILSGLLQTSAKNAMKMQKKVVYAKDFTLLESRAWTDPTLCTVFCIKQRGCNAWKNKDNECQVGRSTGKIFQLEEENALETEETWLEENNKNPVSFTYSMSSTFPWFSNLAVDRCFDQNEGSYCNTDNEVHPYFLLTFAARTTLLEVKLKNRCPSDYNRYRGMKISIFEDVPTVSGSTMHSGGILFAETSVESSSGCETYYFSPPYSVAGMYLVIQDTGTETTCTNLAEVYINSKGDGSGCAQLGRHQVASSLVDQPDSAATWQECVGQCHGKEACQFWTWKIGDGECDLLTANSQDIDKVIFTKDAQFIGGKITNCF